ncbi:MAG: B12-binding domain-containing radical SAM protein [Sedimentisphaerales bacterium]|nr:B12-binding domain-containing radical SAM protein [Sedimentisphaerales bacterium]
MKPRILLINPPIYDFSAYDFWLKPYGLLTIGGFLQNKAHLSFFDYLDRLHPAVPTDKKLRSDQWGRGEFHSQPLPKPPALATVPRHYNRFGLPRHIFQQWLENAAPFDCALIQTTMTYWYLGVKEVIEDIKKICPKTKIVLGGVYATICPQHAQSLGADLVAKGADLEPLWQFLNIAPTTDDLPLWQSYPKLETGVVKLTDGCPFKCSYCSVPQTYKTFAARPPARVIAEFELLRSSGVSNIAFYDDALLFDAEHILVPFLQYVIQTNSGIHFHTPNALHARFITPELARLMAQAGFKTFCIGLESSQNDWHKQTGSKVCPSEFTAAVKNLHDAGASPQNITAYIIAGHPTADISDTEASMYYAHQLGVRIMLADFSPIPNTPDGRLCEKIVDMAEPLWHSKTAFPIAFLGDETVNRLKDRCRECNGKL